MNKLYYGDNLDVLQNDPLRAFGIPGQEP